MKEKNWLTWLTVLALVVGFAAMGASVWLSAQAAKQTQRNSQLAGQLYQASRTSSSEASSVKKRLDKLASDNSSLRKKNSRLAKENQALKEANQDLPAASGVYWFKGNRGQIEKIGSQAHFKRLLRQISLNKLEESPLLVKKTKTEKKKKQTSKKTTKKAEKQSSKKKVE